MSQPVTYRIGDLARRTGVSVDTLRFYEKRRLLTTPRRTAAGYRVYTDAAVREVRFVRRAQTLGLSLDDIRRLADGSPPRSPAASCLDIRALLARRAAEIDRRIRQLHAFRRALRRRLAACEGALAAADPSSCPTLHSLDIAGEGAAGRSGADRQAARVVRRRTGVRAASS